MYAVVRTGGKQYRVAVGDEVLVEKLAGEPGDRVVLSDVVFLRDENGIVVGGDLGKAVVEAEIVGHEKGDKVVVFKFKRRKNYRVKTGHRQLYTRVRIVGIGTGGKATKATKATKAEKSAESAEAGAPAPAEAAEAQKKAPARTRKSTAAGPKAAEPAEASKEASKSTAKAGSKTASKGTSKGASEAQASSAKEAPAKASAKRSRAAAGEGDEAKPDTAE